MNKSIGVVAVLALVLSGVSLLSTPEAVTERVVERVETRLGADSGPEKQERQLHRAGTTVGGRVATTSTAATYTTAAADFAGLGTYLDWTPNVNTTVSISATSTHRLVPNVGDTAKIYLRNASSTAASSITLAAANANVDLQFTEATGGDLVLNGLDWAEITLIRESAYLTTVIFSEFTEAD